MRVEVRGGYERPPKSQHIEGGGHVKSGKSGVVCPTRKKGEIERKKNCWCFSRVTRGEGEKGTRKEKKRDQGWPYR